MNPNLSTARPATAGLTTRFTGMTDGRGTYPVRRTWDVFEGEARVGYVYELRATAGVCQWHAGEDIGTVDSLDEALPEIAESLREQREDAALAAERAAEIEALPELARLAEYAAVQAEIAHLVATRRNVLDPDEVSATRKAWDDARAVALRERLRGSLGMIDAERAA